MTDWLDLVLDARPVRAVFGDATPSLRGVLVESVTLQVRSGGIELAVALADYPADPPLKWRQARNNVVWLGLAFEEAETVEVHGPLTGTPADLLVARDGDHVVAELRGTTQRMKVRCRWFHIRRMTAGQVNTRPIPDR